MNIEKYSGMLNKKNRGSADNKKALIRLSEKFFKEEYGFKAQSISVMLDSSMLLIRVNHFLCPAEQKLGAEKHHIDLIHQMHRKIFEKAKRPFIKKIQDIIGRKIVSSQSGLDFETKTLLMMFFLSS